MKIKGLKKAVGEYRQANSGGAFSARYGKLMFDTSDGELWTDWFFDLGHNSYNRYRSETIINLDDAMAEYGALEITMHNVKEFITKHFKNF